MGVDQNIAAELTELGYQPRVIKGDTVAGLQHVVVFPYQVKVGRFKGETRNVGISTECEAVGYPEFPPHWIFINPPIIDTQDGSNHGISVLEGKNWVSLSRPPGQYWDKVQRKGMRAYLEHLSKVWARI